MTKETQDIMFIALYLGQEVFQFLFMSFDSLNLQQKRCVITYHAMHIETI